MARLPPSPVFTLRGTMSPVHCLLFEITPESELLYATTQTGTICRWNLRNCREEPPIELGRESCLAIRRLDQYYVTQDRTDGVKVWSERDSCWQKEFAINLEYMGFCRVECFKNEYIICPEADSRVRIFNVSNEIVNTFHCNSEEKLGEVMALSGMTLSGTDCVLVLYECGILRLFKLFGNKVSDIQITLDCPMALDFDGLTKGVVGSSGKDIIEFELSDQLELYKKRVVSITNPGVSSIKIRPDRKLFAAGCWDGRIRLFSAKSLKLLVILDHHKEAVQDVCFSSIFVKAWNCQWLLAAAGKDCRITLWDVYND